MRPREPYKTQSDSVALKKFPWATNVPRGRINYSVSLKRTMSDLVFHVYKDNQVKAHNLSVDELEDLIISKKVKLGEVEIEPLEVEKNQEASY